MTKTAQKRMKKDERKKLMVRIVCMVLVVALVVTSILAVLPSLFQSSIDPELQAMIDAGYAYVADDGSIYLTQAYIDLLTTEAEPVETTDGAEAAEDHEGHDHE